MKRGLTLVIGLSLVVGCDQFARVGALRSVATSADAAGALADAAAGGTSVVAPACVVPTVAVCDPVKNEGCPAELRMQCAVDLTLDVLAGYCIFQGPPAPDGSATCLNTGATENCGPTMTCVLGGCRRLCFCDSDCAANECCVDKIGQLGFKACAACR